ncbi:glycosyltransferase family 39 protein [Pseudovibrio axinellae]|nr:glycosyltransferase family 39 protein [Pseudovibrio axinellae]
MSAWMIDIVVQLFGRADWLIFASAQICVVMAILPVILIVRERFGAKAGGYTALAAFLTHFTTISAVEYNVNMGFLPFWGWMVFTFLKAEEKDKLGWWALFGILSAGGMYGKYIAGVFLITVTLWVFLKRRDLLKRPGPYLAAFLFLIALTPHLIWLVHSNFLPIEYAMGRSGSDDKSWFDHILMPLIYVVEFIYSVAPMLLALAIAAGWRRISTISLTRIKAGVNRVWADPFMFAALGPVLVITVISMVLGADIKTAWSIPLGVVFAGLIGISAAALETGSGDFKNRFMVSWAALYGTLVLVYIAIFVASPLAKNKPARMLHDGPELARLVESYWYSHETAPFEYVVGSRWPGGTVAWYSSVRPSLFEKASLKYAPWVDMSDLHQKGALYVDYKKPRAMVAGMCATDLQKMLWPAAGGKIYKKHPEVWVATLKPATGLDAVTCVGN